MSGPLLVLSIETRSQHRDLPLFLSLDRVTRFRVRGGEILHRAQCALQPRLSSVRSGSSLVCSSLDAPRPRVTNIPYAKPDIYYTSALTAVSTEK